MKINLQIEMRKGDITGCFILDYWEKLKKQKREEEIGNNG